MKQLVSSPILKQVTRALLGCVLSSASVTSFAAGLDIRPLAESRETLKPEAYSAADRELVARQALLFIKNLYVHRELKITDFGAQVDPVPRIEDMVRRAASMSDADFHAAMQKIFLDLHDHHTNYAAPMPLRCSYVLAPLDFADVYDGGKLKIIVKSQSRLLKSYAPEAAKAKPGDELIALNGKPIADVLEDLRKLSGGANEDAMTTGAVMNLAITPLSEIPVPAEDTITYSLKRGSETITIESKLFAAINVPACVEETRNEEARGALKPSKKSFLRAENPRVRDYKDLVLPPSVAPFADEETLPVGRFYTISTPAGKLAKLDLETFVPEDDSSPDTVIHKIRTLLEKAQPDAAALIIDMRSNGGGLILLAEGLTQLFTPNQIKTMPVRFLPNDLNLSMFLNSNQGTENGWTQDTRDGITAKARYTKPRVITSEISANRYGQVWFKPVVILTDANCYSACDLFAASMQDHGAATIIGTHATTGAGGANVMEYGIFRQIFNEATPDKNPFLALPGKQKMRVSWRQTIRVGKNEGQLIEDSGVKSDIVVRYVTEDVIGGESRVLMREVHKAIEKIIPRYKSSIKLASGLVMANGEHATWQETVRGIDTLDVMQDGKVVASYPVSADDETVTIDMPQVTGEWSEVHYDVVGRLNKSTQFRVVREARWRGPLLNANTELKETFASDLTHWHANVLSGKPDSGWQVKNNVLRVGNGEKYAPNLSTQVFAYVNTAGKSYLTLDLAILMETEPDMDFVNVILRDPVTGHEEYIASLSGQGNIAPADKVRIPVNEAKQVELVFEFTSDENWHMKGPEISKLAIQAK